MKTKKQMHHYRRLMFLIGSCWAFGQARAQHHELRLPDPVTNPVPGLGVESHEVHCTGSLQPIYSVEGLGGPGTRSPHFGYGTDIEPLTPDRRPMLGTLPRYGVIYRGFVFAPCDGTYTFEIAFGNASRFYIGNQLVVDNDGHHQFQTVRGTISLARGYHAFTCSFFQFRSIDPIQVSWGVPCEGGVLTPLEASDLFLDGPQLEPPEPVQPDTLEPGLAYTAFTLSEDVAEVLLSEQELPLPDPLTEGVTDCVTIPDSRMIQPGALVFDGVLPIDEPGLYEFAVRLGISDAPVNADVEVSVGDTAIILGCREACPALRTGLVGLEPGLHQVRVRYLLLTGSPYLSLGYAGPDTDGTVTPLNGGQFLHAPTQREWALQCPPDRTVSCRAHATVAQTGRPTVSTDVPDSLDISHQDHESEVGTIQRVWTVRTATQQIGTCVQRIIVLDREAPTFDLSVEHAFVVCNAPEATNRSGSGGSQVDSGTAGSGSGGMIAGHRLLPDVPPVPPVSAQDNCAGETTLDFTEVQLGDCPGSIVRTWQAEDVAGNRRTMIQLIVLKNAQRHPVAYWRERTDRWVTPFGPVEDLRLGCAEDVLTPDEALEILEQDPSRDATTGLAQQLIAAQLNLLQGLPDDAMEEQVRDAHDFLCTVALNSQPEGAMKQLADDLARALQSYNEDDYDDARSGDTKSVF